MSPLVCSVISAYSQTNSPESFTVLFSPKKKYINKTAQLFLTVFTSRVKKEEMCECWGNPLARAPGSPSFLVTKQTGLKLIAFWRSHCLRRSRCLSSLRYLISLTPTDVLYNAPLPLTFTSSLILQYIRKKRRFFVRARKKLEFRHVLWTSSFYILPGATTCLLDCEQSLFLFRFNEGSARARKQRARKPREARTRAITRVLLDGPRKQRDCS